MSVTLAESFAVFNNRIVAQNCNRCIAAFTNSHISITGDSSFFKVSSSAIHLEDNSTALVIGDLEFYEPLDEEDAFLQITSDCDVTVLGDVTLSGGVSSGRGGCVEMSGFYMSQGT